MSTYSSTLPLVFPYVSYLTHDEAREAVTALMDKDRIDVQQGSSFALTVDLWNGKWKLWLSETSMYFLDQCIKEGLWKHSFRPSMLQKSIESLGLGE